MGTRQVSCATIVFNPQGRLLFGYKLEYQKWELPGGKLHGFETVKHCACRELHEETGILETSLKYLGYYDGDREWLTHMFTCVTIDEPRVMEPDKHSDWVWHSLDYLPTMIPACADALTLYLREAKALVCK